jgi:HTH-type transcriptional regulator/antitoxin HigA
MTRTSEAEPIAAFIALVREFVPRPIRNEGEYERATALMERLLYREELSSGAQDYLDALTTFIEAYEAEYVTLDDVHGVEMLRALMEMNDLKQKDLVSEFGSASYVSDVLNGRRDLSKPIIKKLAARFNVSPAVFFPA